MKSVRFYRSGNEFVIEGLGAELRHAGNPWQPANWGVTEVVLQELKAENPDVEFVEIPPRHAEQ